MAFSTESILQPHDMSGESSMDRFVVSPAETERWIQGRHQEPEEVVKRGMDVGYGDSDVNLYVCNH